MLALKSDWERAELRQAGAMKVAVTRMCCGVLGSSSEQISPSDTALHSDVGGKRRELVATPSLF